MGIRNYSQNSPNQSQTPSFLKNASISILNHNSSVKSPFKERNHSLHHPVNNQMHNHIAPSSAQEISSTPDFLKENSASFFSVYKETANSLPKLNESTERLHEQSNILSPNLVRSSHSIMGEIEPVSEIEEAQTLHSILENAANAQNVDLPRPGFLPENTFPTTTKLFGESLALSTKEKLLLKRIELFIDRWTFFEKIHSQSKFLGIA